MFFLYCYVQQATPKRLVKSVAGVLTGSYVEFAATMFLKTTMDPYCYYHSLNSTLLQSKIFVVKLPFLQVACEISRVQYMH